MNGWGGWFTVPNSCVTACGSGPASTSTSTFDCLSYAALPVRVILLGLAGTVEIESDQLPGAPRRQAFGHLLHRLAGLQQRPPQHVGAGGLGQFGQRVLELAQALRP